MVLLTSRCWPAIDFWPLPGSGEMTWRSQEVEKDDINDVVHFLADGSTSRLCQYCL